MPVIATTTAAPRRALTTAQRFTAYTSTLPAGLSATRLEALIGQATGLIEDYCGRVFARERVTEAVYAPRGHRLLLERTPIVALHAITMGGEAMDPASFVVEDPAVGIVRGAGADWTVRIWDVLDEGERYNQPEPQVRYEIDYTGGYVAHGWPVTDPVAPVTLPIGLEMACIEVVQNLTGGRGAAAGLQSEKLCDASFTYRADAGHGLGGQVRDMLTPYRRVATVGVA